MKSLSNESMLIAGLLLVGGGVVLLSIISSDSMTGSFFIFPFFFIGDFGPLSIAFVAIAIVMLACFTYQVFHFANTLSEYDNTQNGVQCHICKTSTPYGSTYCPRCGTRIDENIEEM